MRTLATLLLLATLPAIGADDPAAKHTLPADTPAAADGSVYELESTWKDQDGKAGPLRQMGDRTRVVVMGYSTCKFACPRLIADLINIENAVKKTAASDKIGYAFISIDPENDTPAQLKKLESQYSFTPGAWKLLTGDEDGVLELSVALGMKYRKTSPVDFAHSNIITVLRKDGSIAHQQVGLGKDTAPTVAAILAAAK